MPHTTWQTWGQLRLATTLVVALATLTLAAPAGAHRASGAPSDVSAPTLKGSAVDGKKLRAKPGEWSGAKPISYTYGWQLCNAVGGECSTLSTQGSALVLTSQDVGHTVRAVVRAGNGAGSESATSAPSAKVLPATPRRKKLPVLEGAAQDGQVLTVGEGTWRGSQPMGFSYQWQSCVGRTCSDIPGATQRSYRAATAQIGQKLRVLVTATNEAGSAVAASKRSALVEPGPPVDVSAPSVSGLPILEQTLTAEVGTWAGTGPFEYSYQWRGCNLLGECENISGATGPTYTVGPLQIANSIEVVVTAKNLLGSAAATSEPTNVVKALLPSNLELPSVTGLLQDGGLLSALVGSWSGTGPLEYSYAWELCNSAGAACHEISGALQATLGLLAGDVGSTLRVLVTATNSAGSTSALSEPTSVVEALLPSNLELPSVTGLLQDGGLLSALVGSWSGTGPIEYSYAWELCNGTGGACHEVSGAAGSTLGVLASEVGDTVRLVVTATNAGGSTSATSEPTSVVKALLPSNLELPSVTGLLQDGGLLSAVKGSWSGTGPIEYGYAWELCNGSGGACHEISGAIGSTLGLMTSEIGDTVRLVVTATNAGGSTSATSEPTSVVKALLPSNLKLPSIAGLLQEGGTLEGAKGSWSGSEPLSFGYQWELCNSAGAACHEISGAIGSTLGVLASEIGDTIRLVVTATNAGGSTSATSEPTSVVKALLPSNLELPSIQGVLQTGRLLTALVGNWSGTAPIAYSYQWQTCGILGLERECVGIAKAIESTLKLELLDVGLTLRVIVTATNQAGAVSKPSSITGLVAGLL